MVASGDAAAALLVVASGCCGSAAGGSKRLSRPATCIAAAAAPQLTLTHALAAAHHTPSRLLLQLCLVSAQLQGPCLVRGTCQRVLHQAAGKRRAGQCGTGQERQSNAGRVSRFVLGSGGLQEEGGKCAYKGLRSHRAERKEMKREGAAGGAHTLRASS